MFYDIILLQYINISRFGDQFKERSALQWELGEVHEVVRVLPPFISSLQYGCVAPSSPIQERSVSLQRGVLNLKLPN